MTKTILLTFDYELFFKKSGTLEQGILKPTERLLSFFDQHGIKATFFVDVLYYLKLCEFAQTLDQKQQLESQIRALVDFGHRVELHLHSHWQDAVYEDGQWVFPHFRHYRLHHFSDEQIHNFFIKGIHTLEDIAQKSDRNYKVLAFRAGGWCLQPFSRLKTAFLKAGLKIDSSVAPRISRLGSDIQFFDFKSAPQKESYFFKEDPLHMTEAGNDSILEIPISTYRVSFFDDLRQNAEKRKLIKHYSGSFYKVFGDGVGLSIDDVYGSNWKESIFTKINRKLFGYYKMFSLQDAKPDFLIDKINRHPHKIINFLSHPKSLSESSFVLLERMVKENYEFRILTDIHKNI